MMSLGWPLSFLGQGQISQGPSCSERMLHGICRYAMAVLLRWDGSDLQYQAARHSYHRVQWATCAAWHLKIWTSFWRRDGSIGMDMWNASMVQSTCMPLTYRLMESLGLGCPRWHGSSWQRGIAESGSSQLLTLMIDIPGDLAWDLPYMQQALEGGPSMWMLHLYLQVNQKSNDDDEWIVVHGPLVWFTIKGYHFWIRYIRAQESFCCFNTLHTVLKSQQTFWYILIFPKHRQSQQTTKWWHFLLLFFFFQKIGFTFHARSSKE